MFENTSPAPIDPMYQLKKRADADDSHDKVDLGVGIYRNELGSYHEFQCVKEAKRRLTLQNLGHDYEVTVGNEDFLRCAAKLIFGSHSKALLERRVASVQTISGTGANHLGALLIHRTPDSRQPSVYVGTPTWGNYKPLFQLVGFKVIEYQHYDRQRKSVNFDSCIQAMRKAPRGSVFVLQACCHNPTGANFNQEQWKILANEMRLQGHFPFFDNAYQGLGQGLDEDVFGIRLFADSGIEMLVCQSFSKNFGLYGERVGALHVVNTSEHMAKNVHDQLRSLIRWEFSSSPAFGSRLVNIVFADGQFSEQWQNELASIRTRLDSNRARLHELLTMLRTPGDWTHILREEGLFSYLQLTTTQCNKLVDQFRIYLPSNGRINIAGLNEDCIERVAQAIDTVTRESLISPESGSLNRKILRL